MFTSESHPIRVDFIEPTHHGLPGRLGLTIAPGKQDDRWHRDLETDLSRLREEYKTSLLVSLMEGHEYKALRIEELFERAAQHGMDIARFPIRDVSVPPDDAMVKFAELIDGVVAAMRSDRTVVVHCRGGLGRSGVVAACALAALGVEPAQAITQVRGARPGAVETLAQEAWVSSFQAALEAPDSKVR